MAKVKKADIKEYSTEELVEKIREAKAHYQKMEFNHAVTQLDNPITLRHTRRDIARLLTELNERTDQNSETTNPAE